MNRDRETNRDRWRDGDRSERRFHEDHGSREPDAQYGSDDDREARERSIPYGVGAEAAYGVPSDDYYFYRRYRSHLPRQDRPHPRQGRDHDFDWDDKPDLPKIRPGYIQQVPGQISEGGFWTADLDNQPNDRLTGEELRRYQQGFDPDYVSWRDDQLTAHDRDYSAWRDAQRQAYDDDYMKWRRDRQDKFGKEFTDWRTGRATDKASPASGDNPQREPLSASRGEKK